MHSGKSTDEVMREGVEKGRDANKGKAKQASSVTQNGHPIDKEVWNRAVWRRGGIATPNTMGRHGARCENTSAPVLQERNLQGGPTYRNAG